MARRAPCWTAHLVLALLVLAAAARCSAGQQSQYSGGAPAQLRAIISSAVADAAHPIAAELGSLRTLLDGIASRLQVQDARLDALKAVLTSQDARLDALNARLDSIAGLNSRLDSLKDGQDGLNASLAASRDELNTRLDALNTGQDALNIGLDSQNTTLVASLDELNTRLDALNTQVNITVAAALQIANIVRPRDCSDLVPGARTGIYTLRPGRDVGNLTEAAAFCDMDTDGGGWTVFQRRADLRPRQNFFLDWAAYRAGFGNMTGEFWWGLEKLHLMTSARDRRYELRVDLGDWDGERRHALYPDFRISPETDGYRLSGGNYSGDAGDSLSYYIGRQFSTKDRDQDGWSSGHCAQDRKGAWWFASCAESHLNGEYVSGGTSTGDNRGVIWRHWKGWRYSLKTAEMKVRPRRHV